jgi:hypothetical protein
MSDRAARMIVLCEDLQHATFIRRLLKALGFPKGRIRVNRSPDGGGAADQYVRRHYPKEVKEHRRNSAHMHIGLVTAIDADENPVPYRFRQLNEELEAEALDRRGDDEEICILVPKRNIETWIYALFGNEVNETEAYAKLENEGDCQPAVEALVVYLQNTRPDDLIPSLERGCRELNTRLPR